MTNEERIANALEEKNEIIMGIMYGLLVVVLIFGGIFAIMIFGQAIYDFFTYDLLGNERPPSPVYAVAQATPIDDCNYSNDRQLCFQMKRIGDAFENDVLISENTLIIDDFDSVLQKKIILYLMYGNEHNQTKIDDSCYLTVEYRNDWHSFTLDCELEDDFSYELMKMKNAIDWCNNPYNERTKSLPMHLFDGQTRIYECEPLLEKLQDYDYKTLEIGIKQIKGSVLQK